LLDLLLWTLEQAMVKCGFSAGSSMAIYWDIVDITGYLCFL
jgi:hypothetical protein